MAERTLIARVRADGEQEGGWIVASPGVGIADGSPGPGIFLNRFDPVLTLLVLGAHHVVRLPRDVQGWIVESYVTGGRTPVGFDQPLLRIRPQAGPAEGARAGGAARSEAAAVEGTVVVSSPTEGIFYRRSGPDAPAFVELNGTVAAGAVLGLVEVMKCFNQIVYGGPGLPPKGRIVKILAEDSSEVHFGQPLFWIRPE